MGLYNVNLHKFKHKRNDSLAQKVFLLILFFVHKEKNDCLTQGPGAGNIIKMETAMNGKSTCAKQTERGRQRLEAALWAAEGRCVREREGQCPPYGPRYWPG